MQIRENARGFFCKGNVAVPLSCHTDLRAGVTDKKTGRSDRGGGGEQEGMTDRKGGHNIK